MKTDEAPAKAPRPTITTEKDTSDAGRVAAQKAREYERKYRQAQERRGPRYDELVVRPRTGKSRQPHADAVRP